MKIESTHVVPVINIGALFGAEGFERDKADSALYEAARGLGFVSVTGLPPEVPIGRTARADVLRIFQLPQSALRNLWRHKFEPRNSNIYRGWFPVQPGNPTSKEGIDMGADVAYGAACAVDGDPLLEPTPLPDNSQLPGWHDAIGTYYLAMERVCAALMRSIARSLVLDEHFFDDAFHVGLSTLRLLRYPVRTPAELAACKDAGIWVLHEAQQRQVIAAAHTDSGFVTLLAQDDVAGLQVRRPDGSWVDVNPEDRALVVNFGQVLERWSCDRIKATEHRVIGTGQERHSIPFFYEARADAEISPLPMDDPNSFEPFLFGDYLWERITRFVEFRGMQAQRKPARGRVPSDCGI